MHGEGNCKKCKAMIVWALLAGTDRWIKLEPVPVMGGSYKRVRNGDQFEAIAASSEERAAGRFYDPHSC